jgi:putative membrane protein
MKHLIVAAALLGVGFIAYLIASVGAHAVFAAATAVGGGGFAVLCVYSLALIVVLGVGWSVLVSEKRSAGWATFIFGRLIRDSAGEVLPFTQIGAFAIGARAVILFGVPASIAIASTIVDVTTELLAQIAYAIVGVCICILRFRSGSLTAGLTGALTLGAVVTFSATTAFILIQKHGFGLAEKLATRWFPGSATYAASLRQSMEVIYAARARVVASVAIHFLAWLASGLGTWIAVRLMGTRIGFSPVLALESLLCIMRCASAVVPGALGIQEAGYVLLAPIFGLRPEIGLAISLVKRARDFTIGAPSLLVWQGLEGRHALKAE